MDWQPIETAPRDGTKVDLWVVTSYVRRPQDSDGRRVTEAWWGRERHPENWGYERPDEDLWVVNRELLHDAPVEREQTGGAQYATHWMPLPEPPSP